MGICRFVQELNFAQEIHAHVAQLAERVLGKDEVTSSNLVMGSIIWLGLETASLKEQTEKTKTQE